MVNFAMALTIIGTATLTCAIMRVIRVLDK